MDKKQEILNKLEQSKDLLHEVLILLKEENLDDKQLDYCTCPSLANRVDELALLYKNIDKIVYQK